MNNEPNCPKCNSEHTYADGNLWVCPECGNEWSQHVTAPTEVVKVDDGLTRDAHGSFLVDGDSVVVVKDLKIKGSSSSVKVGTKVKNIRLTDGGDGHNLSGKIDGFGVMNLKSEFVKKV
jgi:protein PhnA